MNHWFTVDTHFGHKNINLYTKRPYNSVLEMDEALISNWNSVVGRDDIVYHLGDFGLANLNYLIGIRNRLKGKIIFIEGNHDKRNARRFKDIFFEYYEYWHWVTINNQKILLCHYPFYSWDEMHYGKTWHLYGHVHNSIPDMADRYSLNVGVDVTEYFPIHFDSVEFLMKQKNIVPMRQPRD